MGFGRFQLYNQGRRILGAVGHRRWSLVLCVQIPAELQANYNWFDNDSKNYIVCNWYNLQYNNNMRYNINKIKNE